MNKEKIMLINEIEMLNDKLYKNYYKFDDDRKHLKTLKNKTNEELSKIIKYKKIKLSKINNENEFNEKCKEYSIIEVDEITNLKGMTLKETGNYMSKKYSNKYGKLLSYGNNTLYDKTWLQFDFEYSQLRVMF